MGRLEDCVKHLAVSLCLRIFRWFPVTFIVGVVCWSYYAYVVELCIFTVRNVPEKVAYLIPYHIILFMFLWAYWQTAMTPIGSPPKHFKIPPAVYEQMQQSTTSGQREILERLGKNLPISMRTFDGAVRWCEKCKLIKPDRTHHCSICGVCVLKMDHHCPWVNTCVHYRNYKYFIQFLGYALLFCLFVFLTDIYYFIWFWTDGLKTESGSKFHIMFLFFVAGMFGISVSSLFFYHLWLTGKNRSTLEAFRAPVFRSGPDKDGFNLGCRSNFAEIFGNRISLAFLPIFTSRGDGTVYPLSSKLESSMSAIAVTAPEPANLIIEKEGNHSFSSQPPPPPPEGPKFPLNAPAQSSPTQARKSMQTALPPITDSSGPGDGVTYPVRTFDTDEDGLLQHHDRNQQRRWADDDEETSGTDYENAGGEGRGGGGPRRPKENPFPLTSIGIHA